MSKITINFTSNYGGLQPLNKFVHPKSYSKNSLIRNIVKNEFDQHIKEIKARYGIPTIVDPTILEHIHINYADKRVSEFERDYSMEVLFSTNNVVKVSLIFNNLNICDVFTIRDCSIKQLNKLIKSSGINIGKTHNINHNSNTVTNFDAALKVLFGQIYEELKLHLVIINPTSKTITVPELMDIDTPNNFVISETPKAKSSKKIPKAVRTAVWNAYYPENIKGKCYVGCGEDITVHNFECGHVVARVNGGDISVPNLRPICSSCNKSMGTHNLEEFKRIHKFSQTKVIEI
jgi:hypothetical protein